VEAINNYFRQLSDYAVSHGVSPTIFVIIFILSIPFFYYPLFKFKEYSKLLKQASKDKNESNNLKNVTIKYILIIGLAWASPYLYVLVFGHGLPLLFTVLMVLYLVFGLLLLIYKYGSFSNNENRNR